MSATITRVDLPSTRTEIYRKGDGPTLLLIQGGGTGKRAWYPIIDRLADRVNCVAFDNRGVGHGADIGDSLTIHDLAGDAAELIEWLGEGPVHVAGVSLGGMIAMRLASERPDLVKSLTLHSTSAQRNGRGQDAADFRMRILDLELPVDMLRRYVALWSEGSAGLTWDIPEDVVNTERFDPHNYRMQLGAVRGHHMSAEELGRITSPTLITVGSDDILTTPEDAKHLWRSIPDARLVTVEGGGHGYYIADPDLVALLQAGWVAQHSKAG
ncbi:alpha/beta fold hydrolase [Microbacterium immunditiarum]|uniref:Pimeloyl-ACP methyl ester carboxylesterase n=1 Tax=Microbacterium immunditiarum TaxID=337480 RepID=A0A7Y9GLN9_9MICO|nr:alpha/beta hydrolase [Microbacterium immunditiarum]NYE18808.1 pimeloyl-ACP methyl ester carboxylesterase [Microbacterium immunditiarum]